MQDILWEAVYRALRTRLCDDDVLLAPQGDWPAFCCTTRFYDDKIELGDATVVVLHKGRLAGARKSEVARLATEWNRLFVNPVFVVFSRDRRGSAFATSVRSLLCHNTVGRYLASARNRRLSHRIFYMHMPKTGGRSVWLALRRALPSNIYYANSGQLMGNPPGQEYDLIAGHFSFASIAPLLSEEDWVVGMVRSPTARFRSAFLHARRSSEDVSTFTPAMRAMRDLSFADFLNTEYGKVEARQQLVMLGGAAGLTLFDEGEQPILARAISVLGRPRSLFGPCEASERVMASIARQFRLRLRSLPRINCNDYHAQSADVEEFDAAEARIAAENVLERTLYREIKNRFEHSFAKPS